MSKRGNNEHQRVCLFCENASVLNGDDNLLCKYKGIVSEDFVCRKYVYDPLKRIPMPKPSITPLSPDDII